MKKKDKIIGPNSVLKIIKLWPYARKQGREIGQIWTVGYYCRHCGLDIIWLVNSAGEYVWTIEHDFLVQKFEVLFDSKNKDFFGRKTPMRNQSKT